jgi:hypothetical protein
MTTATSLEAMVNVRGTIPNRSFEVGEVIPKIPEKIHRIALVHELKLSF